MNISEFPHKTISSEFPYKVVSKENSGSKLEWCHEVFGDNEKIDAGWRVQIGRMRDLFLFKREEDLILFKLRWM